MASRPSVHRALPSFAPAEALAVGLMLGCAAGCAGTGDAPLERGGEGGSTVGGRPAFAEDHGGPARSAHGLYAAFDTERAVESLEFADRFYRAPASDGYEAVFAHVRERLAASGFGRADGFELEEIVVDPDFDAWTPRGARAALVGADGTRTVLHAFDDPNDVDRMMLAVGAPAGEACGRAVFELDEVEEGTVLVIDSPATYDILRRARMRGAVAVFSASLAGYNLDPWTGELLTDAVQFRLYPRDAELMACQISRASLTSIREAHEAYAGIDVELEVRATRERRPLKMLAATVVGATRPEEAVVVCSHIQYAGASDNASGMAASLEGARVLLTEIEAGRLPRPARSLVFLWGPEIRQSEAWMAQTDRTPFASVTVVTTGDSAARGGSPQLLERGPDPGAVRPLPPDQHTQWGSEFVDPTTLRPDGLAVVARCALADVAAHVGGWRTQDHPWEGGSDHDTFIDAGVPAVLFWHFTSPWYHTSLDRLDKVDPEEMRRSVVTALATALAVADPRPEDLPRYLRALAVDEHLRTQAALGVDDRILAESWHAWCEGARGWLEDLCGG